ncbi:uncharacterized protein IUM83_15305 [Phytophthora cinnamomi]|uniref:uncharacterized protein n=1 Tax=Phytophthora cinnamomi TaxID=4785 RepID=UPI0035596C0E|nr:hypothetical protein IUM83_15305 [Phytophthora cinnamomi]
MGRKGRQTGYRNYSHHEIITLCLIVKQLKPLGGNDWERVKRVYDFKRPKTWPERDADSLKRKFKDLAGTAKPTGKAKMPVHIALAKAAKREMEEHTSVNTMDDGLDDGADDAELLQRVSEAVRAEADRTMKQMGNAGRSQRGSNGDDVSSSEEEADGDSLLVEGNLQDGDVQHGPVGVAQEPDDGQMKRLPSVSGIITRRDGSTIDAALATELDLSDESSAGEDDSEEKSDQIVHDEASTSGVCGALTPGASATTAGPPVDQSRTPSTPTSAPSRKPTGRPKGSIVGHLPTVTSLSREPLRRDPSKAAADAREKQANPKKSASSARLGGQDLRVFRDNITQFAKRSASEATALSAENTYGKTKRVRTARKLSELEKRLTNVEQMQQSGRSDIMEMMLLLREDSDRKEAAEEKRRCEERRERLEAEKRDRDERDRVRREEHEAAENRRQRELDAAQVEREERYRVESAAQKLKAEQWQQEHKENRRRYEQ